MNYCYQALYLSGDKNIQQKVRKLTACRESIPTYLENVVEMTFLHSVPKIVPDTVRVLRISCTFDEWAEIVPLCDNLSHLDIEIKSTDTVGGEEFPLPPNLIYLRIDADAKPQIIRKFPKSLITLEAILSENTDMHDCNLVMREFVNMISFGSRFLFGVQIIYPPNLIFVDTDSVPTIGRDSPIYKVIAPAIKVIHGQEYTASPIELFGNTYRTFTFPANAQNANVAGFF